MDIATILGEAIRAQELVSPNNTLTGPNYLRLSKIAFENGFSDADFKGYIEKMNIKLQSNQPPAEPVRNTRLF